MDPNTLLLQQALSILNTILSIDNNILSAQTQGEVIGDLQGIIAYEQNAATLLTGLGTLLGSMNSVLVGIQTQLAQLATQVQTVNNNQFISDQQLNVQINTQIQAVLKSIQGISVSGGTPSDVWNYVLPGASRNMGAWCLDAGAFALNLSTAGFGMRNHLSPLVLCTTDWQFEQFIPLDRDQPTVDPGHILPTDTLLSWIERESGYTDWTLTPGGYYHRFDTSPGTDMEYTVMVSAADFRLYQGVGSSTQPFPPVPPIWPGLDRVTLGTPVALADQLTVNGPMAGVVIHLTSVPTSKPTYPYAGLNATLHIGALTFVSDNGEAEHIEAINFNQGVYTPKNMMQASSVKVRLLTGVAGTITPWSMNLGAGFG